MIKDKLKQVLSGKIYNWGKRVYLNFLAIPYGFNINKLASIYKSDKWGEHFYTKHYQTHFRKFKFKRVKLFEIGVGGYHYPDMGGSSLRMWKRYFPFGKIFALDIYDKSFVEENRIKIFQGSQVDENVLNKITNSIGDFDIIIDDGSHINEHVIKTFQLLFPKLKSGGIYVIEDMQTSYWPDYGGDSKDLNNSSTMMNYFKTLTDGINHEEYILPNYSPSYFDKNIVTMHFYHNILFIYKGPNNEGSSADLSDPETILADKIYI